MFSKSADPTLAPDAPLAPRAGHAGSNASRSVLAADLKITGEIASNGLIEVLGEIDGNLAADTLVLGTGGRIAGTVHANSVEVRGQMEGRVICKAFTSRAGAQITADVTYQELVIEPGSLVEGRFSRAKS